MRWLTNFYDFRFKWTATGAIGIHPTKMQSGHEDTLEERYAIKFCFKLNTRETYGMLQTAFAWIEHQFLRFKEGRESVRGVGGIRKSEKMPQKRMECFRLLFDHLPWIEHKFLSGIRDSSKADSLWGIMRGVGGVRKSADQSWLAKGLGLGLLYWDFKGVQEEIPREEPSTLQIGSVVFPAGQCISSQRHRCHRLFDQDGHQDSSSASL